MSWNVLAAELAHTHAAELYPQAHSAALEWHRRLAAVVSHVAAQRPDVLCLQEVDDWAGVRKELGTLGYDGVHVQRTGGRGDGCATLWLRDRLRLAGKGAKSGSGSGSAPAAGSGCGSSSGVHKIRMADHGLKDNVALLVHLMPRRGAAGAADGGAAASSCAGAGPSSLGGAARSGREEDSLDSRSNSSGNSGSSVHEGAVAADGSQRPRPPSQGRRPKRTRSSRDESGGGGRDAAAAGEDGAAAATAAMATLRPYPRAGASAAAAAEQRADAAAGAGAAGARLPKHVRRGFWVANTHVLFNTKRGDIKLGQLRVILSELAARALAAEAKDAAPELQGSDAAADPLAAAPEMPVIFAGDFNAAPGSGLYRFLRYGSLHLAQEDRRELSGQVEGYGYSQLQRDTQTGRPPRLTRWGPGLELRNAAAAAAAATAAAASASAAAASATATAPGTSSSSTEEWRRTRQAGQQYPPQHQQQQYQAMVRSHAVRWDEEELVHAMGRVAVVNAVAAVQESSAATAASVVAAGPSGQANGNEAAAGGASQGAPRGNGNGYGNGGGNGNGGWYRGSQAQNGSGSGGGFNGGGRGAPWHAVTQSAVVRHPLQLRSAYAALDEQEREPLFTTLHARYVGTVDFVWYTPGGAGGQADGGAGGEGEGGRGGGDGFCLAPVRVLQPPDPLLYPYGMPCADWPSDHVSLVVDFRLS